MNEQLTVIMGLNTPFFPLLFSYTQLYTYSSLLVFEKGKIISLTKQIKIFVIQPQKYLLNLKVLFILKLVASPRFLS